MNDLSGASIKEKLDQGIAFHLSGALTEAEEIYNQILELQPDNPDALHLSGLVAQRMGNLRKSLKLIKMALDADPQQSLFFNSIGNVLVEDGQFKPALEAYHQALEINPGFTEVTYNLANLLQKMGQPEKSIDHYIRFSKDHPNHFEAHLNMGHAYKSLKRWIDAEKCFLRAVELNPESYEAHFELATILDMKQAFKEAIQHYTRAAEIKPDSKLVWNNLGGVMYALEEFQQARKCYQTALNIDPFYYDAVVNLFNLLEKLGFIKQAIQLVVNILKQKDDYWELAFFFGYHCYRAGNYQDAEKYLRQGIGHNRKDINAYNHLGMALSSQGKCAEALAAFRQAVKIGPQPVGVLSNLGKELIYMGRQRAGLACYRVALRYQPIPAMIHSNYVYLSYYDDTLSNEDLLARTSAWWDSHGARFQQPAAFHNRKAIGRKLRIGYVSADFKRHSVSFFFLPLILSHNRDRFKIYCYSQVKKPDDVTEQIARAADNWLEIWDMSDEAVAKRIKEDRIDILVDLAGHTGGNRLPIFARRPAPIQINWLGFPGTTGLPVMDYRITDAIADPAPQADADHTEELIRLPGGFLCFLPARNTPDVLPVNRLPESPTTFCSFNNIAKLNKKVIEIWAAILKRSPKATLALKSSTVFDPKARERYRELFAKNGANGDQIEFFPITRTIAQHLGLYNRVLVGLDPFPYNGTTTTCEALYMGVPVIALMGHRHSARVSASILSQLGLSELVAQNESEYIDKAVTLGSDLERVELLRNGLRQRMLDSHFCNATNFAAQMETAYRQVWQKYCQTN